MWIWRLSSAEFAERFDGGFGLHQAGRWNDRGRPITYCASGPALCLLEKLVHVDHASLLPDNILLVRYEVPEDMCVEIADMHDMPEDWRVDQIQSRRIGNTWLDAASACLLKVPSVVVPIPESDDWNVLVNHRHEDVGRIMISQISKFEFDSRLQV